MELSDDDLEPYKNLDEKDFESAVQRGPQLSSAKNHNCKKRKLNS